VINSENHQCNALNLANNLTGCKLVACKTFDFVAQQLLALVKTQ